VIRLFSFIVDKAKVAARVRVGEQIVEVAAPPAARAEPVARAEPTAPAPLGDGPFLRVPLIALAHGRSGDKGDIANIGIIGRRAEFEAALRRSLTAEAVRDYFAHYVCGPVERFEWPGLHGFNFVLHCALGGGGVASLRHDPQGKALAQALMDFPIPVPAAWLELGGPLDGWAEVLAEAPQASPA
jgi:hypothetical protein